MDQKTWGFFYAFFSVFKSYPSPYPNTLFNSSKSILVFFFFLRAYAQLPMGCLFFTYLALLTRRENGQAMLWKGKAHFFS